MNALCREAGIAPEARSWSAPTVTASPKTGNALGNEPPSRPKRVGLVLCENGMRIDAHIRFGQRTTRVRNPSRPAHNFTAPNQRFKTRTALRGGVRARAAPGRGARVARKLPATQWCARCIDACRPPRIAFQQSPVEPGFIWFLTRNSGRQISKLSRPHPSCVETRTNLVPRPPAAANLAKAQATLGRHLSPLAEMREHADHRRIVAFGPNAASQHPRLFATPTI
jgi:hypothetical protein